MESHTKFEEVIPIYAIGALDGDELKEFEKHLRAGCSICEELIKENEKLISLIPYSVSGPSPSIKVKERLFEKIDSREKTAEKPYTLPIWKRVQPLSYGLGGVIAAAIMVFLFISNLSLRGRINDQKVELDKLTTQIASQIDSIKSLKVQLDKNNTELATLSSVIASQREIMDFLGNPNVVVINLVNLQPDLKARARLLWNTENNEGFFYGLNLPQTPVGKTYQLWAIADDKPISIGVFSVDDRGNNTMKLGGLPVADQIQKFAVTLEPTGGVPLPTGEMYLVGDS
jgi:anti-sigma-K factor RskA